MRECSCGSGNTKYALYDARGIFCTYVCEACEECKREQYDPRTFTDYSNVEEQIDDDY